MSELKIAYILSKFPAFTETFITREIREIKRQGIEVEVFSLKNLDASETSHPENIDFYNETHYFPFIFSAQIWKAAFQYLKTKPYTVLSLLYYIVRKNINDPSVLIKTLAVFPKALLIASTLKRMKISKIHSHWATIPATVCWIISSLNGSNFSFTAHAWDIFKADNMLLEKMESASRVITISEFNKQYLLSKYPSIEPGKIEVIHIGLDLERFKPKTKTKNSVFKILSVGRMVKTKGFQDLLRACDLLRKKKIKFICQILFVSDIYENEIFKLHRELQLQGVVELISDVTQERIVDFYSGADCFALPCNVSEDGDRDGIPTVIIEALSMELPVISTNVSGIPEIIKDGETGLLIKPHDVNDLMIKIETLYKDEDLRNRLGAAGRKIVQKQFEISTNVKNLLDVIEDP